MEGTTKLTIEESYSNRDVTRRKFLKLTGMATTSLLLQSCFTGDESKRVRFGLVTDSHYADREPKGDRFYREAPEKMREFTNVMNTERVDFVVHLGDFKDEDKNKREEDTIRYLKAIESEFARFKGPRYHCVGNHDVDSITKTQFLSNIENTGIPKDKSYYSFDTNDFHFVVLDANYNKDGTDHFYKDGADWQDTNIPKEEYKWLKKDLDATDLDTIVFCHHPLYTFNRDNYKFHINNVEQVQQLLVSCGKVKAVFQGHVHEEKHAEIDGIHYSTQLALVDLSGLENNSYSIVTLENNQIKIDGYKRVSDQTFVKS